jgi:uncharacterized protein (DUF983 family)
MTRQSPKSEGQPAQAAAALSASCPRCGAATLFDGVAKFAPRCRSCGLDFTQFNVGDGPAAFLTLIIGALVTVLALVVDWKFAPPLWVHAVLWIPFTALAVVGSLRVGKAWLLQAECRRQAREAVIEDWTVDSGDKGGE